MEFEKQYTESGLWLEGAFEDIENVISNEVPEKYKEFEKITDYILNNEVPLGERLRIMIGDRKNEILRLSVQPRRFGSELVRGGIIHKPKGLAVAEYVNDAGYSVVINSGLFVPDRLAKPRIESYTNKSFISDRYYDGPSPKIKDAKFARQFTISGILPSARMNTLTNPTELQKCEVDELLLATLF